MNRLLDNYTLDARMREHGRYTPEVRDEVYALEPMGYFRFEAPNE